MIVDLYPMQDDFVHDEHRYPAFIGGRNSGKTYAGSWKAVTKAAQGGLGCIAAPSFPMLEHGAKAQFIARLNDIGVPYHLTRSSVEIPSWSAEVVFVTLESESRVRGPNYSWAWPDEVEYVADRNVWKALKGAVREGDNPQIFPTSTPKGRRLVWDEWIANATEHHTLHKATTYDNPFIDADDYVAGLNYAGRFYEQEIAADFVAFEGLIYPGFDREKVVHERDVEGWRRIIGVDIGTNNPTAILTIAVGADTERHVESEVYRRRMSSDEIVDAIAAEADRVKAESIFVDPSAAGYIKSLQDRGYPARKVNNEVRYGIGVVTSAIADGLTVDPSCVNLVTEFEAYHYDDAKVETDKPDKSEDHACDALRYGLVGAETGMLSGELFV